VSGDKRIAFFSPQILLPSIDTAKQYILYMA